MDFQKLKREFYLQPTLTVARQLLNKLFVRKINDIYLVGKIVETEAYLPNDPASHSYRGKTERNSVMFREGGCLYVYFTYGMHFCCNAVTEKEGKGAAVLLRSIEPISGTEEMRKNRITSNPLINLNNLTNGPAKICQSFSITREQNGIDLLGNEIFIAENAGAVSNDSHEKIAVSTRIGLQKYVGDEKKWRFFLNGNNYVSRR